MSTNNKKIDLAVTEHRDHHAGIKRARSPHSPALEKKFREANPVCACCGSSVRLNVHHKKPFHLHPELELDENNLITLCMDPTIECHIRLGHGDDFRAYNPNVDEDVKKVHDNRTLMEEVSVEAKKDRLYE